MSAALPDAGFVVFHVLQVHEPAVTDELTASLAKDVAGRLPPRVGFVSARIHRATDGTKVITRTLWQAQRDYEAAAHDGDVPAVLTQHGESAQVEPVGLFQGTPVAGIAGPQAEEPPGIVAFAVRLLRDRAAFPSLMDLLARSEDWKRHHQGFIRATPYIGLDGTTFVNYPAWTDEKSYRAWMADPRLSLGQEEITRLEAAPPEFVLCTVTAHINAE